ncbi:hypothetical protein ACFL2V_12795 [Pseudomonadota bacterium]
MWLLALGFSVVAISTQRRLARWIRKRASQKLQERFPTTETINQVVQTSTIEHPEPELDEVQQAILKRFGFSDLQRLHIDQIYNGVQFGRLKVDQAVRGLVEFSFLRCGALSRQGKSYNLTAEGTNYIIEQGWAN